MVAVEEAVVVVEVAVVDVKTVNLLCNAFDDCDLGCVFAIQDCFYSVQACGCAHDPR